MTIRDSRYEDIPRMLELFDAARGIMRSDGNMTQWLPGYPSEDLLRSEIEKGYSHIIEDDGKVVAVFSFIIGRDPTYSWINGAWLDDEAPYGTIHRIASTPDSHGVAKALFDWCGRQIPVLRIDTHKDNRIMQKCILKAGFTYCGIIHIADGSERLAYQRLG